MIRSTEDFKKDEQKTLCNVWVVCPHLCTSSVVVESSVFVWSSSLSQSIRLPTESARNTLSGLKGSTTIDSVPLISALQKGQPPPPPSDSWKNKKNVIYWVSVTHGIQKTT
jgi:hypothetical protein